MIFAFLRFQSKYQPTQEAWEAMQSDETVIVTTTSDYDFYQLVTKPDHAIVIYPDERFHPAAYAVFAKEMAQRLDCNVFVRHYPLGSTLLGMSNQSKVFQSNSAIQTWDVVMHGNGAFQSSFLKQFPIRSLIFLSGMPPLELQEQRQIMVVRGTLDAVNTKKVWEKKHKLFPKHTVYYEIEGGNFSNYVNSQLVRDDFVSTLTIQNQQEITIRYIEDFLKGLSLLQ